MTTSNCSECGIEVSYMLLINGRCFDCDLDYTLSTGGIEP